MMRPRSPSGAYLYRPRNTLLQTPVCSHLDDLESLYYLFFFIIVGHDGPNLAKTRPAKTVPIMETWLLPSLDASTGKGSHLALRFQVQVKEWYSPVKVLLQNLHEFFRRRISMAGGDDMYPPTENPGSDLEDQDPEAKARTRQQFEDFIVQSCGDFEEFLNRFHESFSEPEFLLGVSTESVPPTSEATMDIDLEAVATNDMLFAAMLAPGMKALLALKHRSDERDMIDERLPKRVKRNKSCPLA